MIRNQIEPRFRFTKTDNSTFIGREWPKIHIEILFEPDFRLTSWYKNQVFRGRRLYKDDHQVLPR